MIPLPKLESELLHHGGGVQAAVARYGIPFSSWMDLSTGINPYGWRPLMVPEDIWQRLPENEDDLVQAARAYYNTEQILPVAGSQAAIQTLPMLRQPCRVGVLDPGYAEHAHTWRRCRHQVRLIPDEEIDQAISELDVLIIVNPNNPTGKIFPITQLLDWYECLAPRGGWLVIDEAFIDCTPEQSLASYCTRPGLIVLRSLGKFFGLAGARVGFVCAQEELLIRLNVLLGPWTISSASRWIAGKALKDTSWQQRTRARLILDSARLQTLLSDYGFRPSRGCVLFQWSRTPFAADMHQRIARFGILTRLFVEPSSLRFGLPGSENDWDRLNDTLGQVTESISEKLCPATH